MAQRLRYDAFSRWLHDPKLMRPGTRMPSFFVDGRGGFTQFLDGDADKQVDAVWAYLSLGEFLPLPDGLIDPAGLELDVTDEPIVFRTFIKQAGVRAVACGYPEHVHCAFDAEKCRLAIVRQGPFLNAKGAWAVAFTPNGKWVVSGDFAGTKAIRAVSEYLKANNATVTAFYLSNVEQYLFQQGDDWRKFFGNVGALPLDGASTFIRSVFNGMGYNRGPTFGGPYMRNQQLLASILDQVKMFNEGKITWYDDVIRTSR
jgi:hypothetical protein